MNGGRMGGGQGVQPPLGVVLAVIALGGAGGSCARYGLALAWPTRAGMFPWATWVTNLAGCAAIGVLLAVLTSGRHVHPLVRPLLGVGVLGGFTTFSTAMLDTRLLVAQGRPALALAYLGLTTLGALAATGLTLAATARLLARRRECARRQGWSR